MAYVTANRRMKRAITGLLVQRATVYTRNAGTGAFSTVVKQGLACSLQPIGQGNELTNEERTQVAESGHLYYDADYTMPENVRIVVDAFPGTTWAVLTGTVWPHFGPAGINVANRVEVMKQR